jgi:hypothetical protein
MISEQELSKALRVQSILFYALLFSLAVYLFVGLYVGKNAKTTIDADALSTIRTALYAIALVELLIAKPIRNFILKKGLPGAVKTVPTVHPIVQKYRIAMVIACAITESIGIYGLVLFILGKNPIDLYVLIIVSALAMLQFRPKREELLYLFKVDSTTDANNAASI